MHSFHQSRGRVLFEALCVFAIAASFIGAWFDTGTSAFLPAAAVSALYGLVRLFDLRGRKPAAVANASAASEGQGDLLDYVPAASSEPSAEEQPEIMAVAAPKSESSKTVPKKPVRTRRKKPAVAAAVAGNQVEDAPIVVAETDPEPKVVELGPVEQDTCDDAIHAPVAPLFEPEPFVRQQRAVFGRKSG